MLESFVRGDFMRINSKEKFIKLFVCVMAQMGCTIETCDFERDLIKMIHTVLLTYKKEVQMQ